MSGDSVGSQTATALYNAIKDETTSAVLPKLDSVIQIGASETPVDAAHLLWKNSLLAVPVFDDDVHQTKYIGYFDMRDILRAIIHVQQQKQTNNSDEEETDTPAASDTEELASTEEETEEKLDNEFLGEEVIQQTLQDYGDNEKKTTSLKSLAEKRPAYCCTEEDSLEHLCALLAQSDCRRVLIVSAEDNDGRCSDMVSRSTLIQYLATHVNPSDLQETLDEAGIDYRKPVVSINEEATAKQAFELILEKKLYGLAVVDAEGGLVGNTSARDIKLVAIYPSQGAFDLDIMSFLAGVRQEDSVSSGKKAKYPACNVRESSTVGHVLSLLAKTRYHRVFVTNTYMEPVGVISEQDILRFLLEKGKLQLSHDLQSLAE